MTASNVTGAAAESFSVWAPRVEHGVDLVLDGHRIPMERVEGGWWRVDREREPGASYGFSLDGGEPRPDPRGIRLPGGPLGLSEVFDPSRFTWTDQDFAGVSLPSAVIYEMHVGTFTPGGTLDSAVDRLDHLVDLGVDIVELLPLASFPGRFGWGYDGVALFAIHEPYGGPAALLRFVDAAHARGLGVCLDAVYNHLGPSGNFLHELGPYFTDRYHTPWGQALNFDGPDSDEVRQLILDAVTQWFRDFHLDALRLDAVHEMHDDRALPLLEEMAALADSLAHEVGRPLWLIAESDRNDPRTVMTRATSPGGMGGVGLHAQWADDIHHALHVLLTGEHESYYADFDAPGAVATMLSRPFLHVGTYSSFRERTHGRPVDRRALAGWRFVAALQTHDQVGNRREGDPACWSHRERWPAERRCCSRRHTPRCCSWGRSGARPPRGSSSPTTPTPHWPRRCATGAGRSSRRSAGTTTRCPIRRRRRRPSAPSWTGPSSHPSRTGACCPGTARCSPCGASARTCATPASTS